MLRTLKPFFDAEICSTVIYLPNARYSSNPICVSRISAPISVLNDLMKNWSLKSFQIDSAVGWLGCGPWWAVRQIPDWGAFSSLLSVEPIALYRCGRNPVQAYVAILSTILPNFSIKPTPRMCMSASVDMPSKFLWWQNTPALDEFTSLEHQLHSLNDWSNQVSIKLWLISLPAFAFVF